MTSKEILKLVNENPAFHLATVDGDQPRVRGMLLFRADENGFIFHTASTKDVFRQMKENPKAEMCFSCNGTQIRVTGVMEQVFGKEPHNQTVEALGTGNNLKNQNLTEGIGVFAQQIGTGFTGKTTASCRARAAQTAGQRCTQKADCKTTETIKECVHLLILLEYCNE